MHERAGTEASVAHFSHAAPGSSFGYGYPGAAGAYGGAYGHGAAGAYGGYGYGRY